MTSSTLSAEAIQSSPKPMLEAWNSAISVVLARAVISHIKAGACSLNASESFDKRNLG